MSRPLSEWGLALSIAVILLITLVPTGQHVEPVIRLCLICGTNGLASLLLNVALFMPLGMALRLRGGTIGVALAAGFALSLGIELTQLMIPGRYTTLADLVANTAGAGAGALLASGCRGALLPGRGAGRALAAAWAAVALAALALTGGLLSPSVPDGDIYAQWTPELESRRAYEGRVISAHIGEIPLPSTLLPRQEEVRALMRAGAPVEVRFTGGSAPARLAPVLRMVAGPYGEGSEAFQVGVHGDDLVIRPRYRADDLYLSRPDLRVRGSMAGIAAGDTLRVRVGRDPAGGHRVSLDEGAPVLMGVTAGRGWSLMRYIGRLPDRALRSLDVVWLLMLFAPLGWWAPTRILLVLLGAAPLAALAFVPAWTPLLATPLLEYAAAAGGLVAGHGLRSRVERMATPRAK